MPSPQRPEEEPGKGLVPAGLVEDCIEVHLARHAPTGRPLYLSTLALTLAAAAALPVVRVPVTVHANGVLRPTVERQEARTAESGIVHSIRTRDGHRVTAGDTLVILDTRSVAARLATVDSIAHSRELELSDLARLLDAGDSLATVVDLYTAHRRQQVREYAEVLSELAAREATERRAADRLRMLLARGFVPPEHLERQEAAHQTASAEIRQHRERFRSDWSGAHARLADERRRLLAERADLTDALARLVVVAPVSGTVEMAASFSPGSVLQRGERVATISPNTPLIGEVLLTTRDVALIGPGTPGRLMIDALNYREWGAMDATVVEVADDATFGDAGPVFRVRCRLSGSELRLRSGQRAALGKGMTFRASFVVAERSLWQRLFNRVNGWIDPARADARTPVGSRT